MGPNNLCHVTHHFLFFSLCRHVTFYKTLTSLSTVFIKAHIRFLQLLKWPCSTSFFYPCGALVRGAVCHLMSGQALRNHTDNFKISERCAFFIWSLFYMTCSVCYILTILKHFVIKLRVKLSPIFM